MSKSKDGFFDQPTRVIGSSNTKPGAQPNPSLDQSTKAVGERRAAAPTATPPGSPAAPLPAGSGAQEEQTRLYRAAPVKSTAAPESGTKQADREHQPVVGWVVVVSGPGKGQSLELSYGWNSIGRGDDQSVSLNFGDTEISRSNHCAIAYDPKNRNFFIQHGGGRNLTYIGNDPVLAPVALQPYSDISLGNTTLRFVPFCGGDFDWQDQPEEDSASA